VTLVRRAGGRFARRGTFRTIAGCGTIRDATLARPVFGGRGGRLPAQRRPRGAYTATIRARPVGSPAETIRLTTIRS